MFVDCSHIILILFFFLNDTAPTEIYTLPLHDALPISGRDGRRRRRAEQPERAQHHREERREHDGQRARQRPEHPRSEEHTSELQSRQYLVCRLLLEKKKKNIEMSTTLQITKIENLRIE